MIGVHGAPNEAEAKNRRRNTGLDDRPWARFRGCGSMIFAGDPFFLPGESRA